MVIALVASLVVGGQIASILLQGKTVCLNDGCQVVEGLTLISPLAVNLLGLGYFLILAGFWPLPLRGENPMPSLPSLLLLAGAGIEGVLLSYQQFAVRTFCSYCLTVAGFVLLLNLLHGLAADGQGRLVFGGVVLASALLNFGPALLVSRAETLQAGVYAVRQGEIKSSSYHLFLSATCPHCQKVLDALGPVSPLHGFDQSDQHAPPEIAALNSRNNRIFHPKSTACCWPCSTSRRSRYCWNLRKRATPYIKGKTISCRSCRKSAPLVRLPPAATGGQSFEGMSTQDGQQEEGECTIDESCVDQK